MAKFDKRVLIVDGDPDFVFLLHRSFLRAGFANVDWAQNGFEASKFIIGFEGAAIPDLILTDFRTEGVDGLQSSALLIPIFALSDEDNPTVMAAALAAGVKRFMRKPVCPQDFVKFVEEIVQHCSPK